MLRHLQICALCRSILGILAKTQIGAMQREGKGCLIYGLCIVAVIAILFAIVAICCHSCIGYSPKSSSCTHKESSYPCSECWLGTSPAWYEVCSFLFCSLHKIKYLPQSPLCSYLKCATLRSKRPTLSFIILGSTWTSDAWSYCTSGPNKFGDLRPYVKRLKCWFSKSDNLLVLTY